jgi:hypothetical protein
VETYEIGNEDLEYHFMVSLVEMSKRFRANIC